MIIILSSGHGLKVRGANGYLDEVDEARKVVECVGDYLLANGVGVQTFHDDISTTQQENLETIVDFHNSCERDLDVSVHFNAYQDTSQPMGTECLYVTQAALADDVADAVAQAGNLVYRGGKYRSDLYFLNNTTKPAILIETCFVDSSADAETYRDNFDAICKAIAVTIGQIEVAEPPPVKPPSLPIEDDTPRVDIVGAIQGDVLVLINGQPVNGSTRCPNVVAVNIRMHGEVTVSINGQDFHNVTDAIPVNQTEIIATVFGGSGDPNYSAYGPYDVNGNGKLLNDSDLYVALPDRFEEDERPMVRVVNKVTGLTATASIEDVGPWNHDDPYWENCTRPQAESGTDMQGETTNGAGIDLSPALAAALGVDGTGKVDWDFVD